MSDLVVNRSRSRADRSGVDLVQLGKAIWAEMPLMMAANLLLTIVLSVSVVIGLTIPPLGPILAAVAVAPVWLGTVAICDLVLNGDGPGFVDLLRQIRLRARTAITISVAPAVVAVILVLSLGLLGEHSDQQWLWGPIAIDAVVLSVLMLGTFTIFPLALWSTLTGRARWVEALALAGKHLVATLGMAALVVLLGISIRFTGPFLALIMSAPIAMLSTATVRNHLNRDGEA
jgi:hypothetical protein